MDDRGPAPPPDFPTISAVRPQVGSQSGALLTPTDKLADDDALSWTTTGITPGSDADYHYRRVKGRKVKEYFGRGPLAVLAALVLERNKQERRRLKQQSADMMEQAEQFDEAAWRPLASSGSHPG